MRRCLLLNNISPQHITPNLASSKWQWIFTPRVECLVKTSELGLSRVGPAQAVQLGCSHRGFGWTVHFQGISHTFGKAVLAADRKLHVLPCGLLCGAALECALHRDFCRLPQESVLCGAEGLLYHTNSMFLFVHLCLSHCHNDSIRSRGRFWKLIWPIAPILKIE